MLRYLTEYTKLARRNVDFLNSTYRNIPTLIRNSFLGKGMFSSALHLEAPLPLRRVFNIVDTPVGLIGGLEVLALSPLFYTVGVIEPIPELYIRNQMRRKVNNSL